MESWILDAAVSLNGGVRRTALVALAQRLGLHVDTVRRWVRGDRKIMQAEEVAIRSLLELEELRRRLALAQDVLNAPI